ncbi:hypothetical protein [Corynebacterium macclintockiae]|uniref:hypothetical protein n=1 Tax=Corynebacterium macclintockiae TaxID=2913501 RepID=UPI003EBFB4EA
MTSQQQLAKLEQQAKALAEQIEQLECQINNAQPTSGLLGRWATNSYGKQVLITADKPSLGRIETAYIERDGTTYEQAEDLDDLTFPEQTTRPQDVPVGEAWLVDAQDRVRTEKDVVALKTKDDLWTSSGFLEWTDDEVELITPLIPARPQDTPETVTTEEEYEALPEGTIVAENNGAPWQKLKSGEWISHIFPENRPDDLMDGLVCRILRRGWGE